MERLQRKHPVKVYEKIIGLFSSLGKVLEYMNEHIEWDGKCTEDIFLGAVIERHKLDDPNADCGDSYVIDDRNQLYKSFEEYTARYNPGDIVLICGSREAKLAIIAGTSAIIDGEASYRYYFYNESPGFDFNPESSIRPVEIQYKLNQDRIANLKKIYELFSSGSCIMPENDDMILCEGRFYDEKCKNPYLVALCTYDHSIHIYDLVEQTFVYHSLTSTKKWRESSCRHIEKHLPKIDLNTGYKKTNE